MPVRGPRGARACRSWRSRARQALVLAGDSTIGLDVARAEAYYGQALELSQPGTPGRSLVVAKAGRAAFQAGRVAEAADLYEEAIAGLLAADGDLVGWGETLNRLSSVLWNQGEAGRSRGRPGSAPLSCWSWMSRVRSCARPMCRWRLDRVISGHSEEALAWADKALALAEQLGGMPEVRVQALDYRGVARGDLGDLGGLDDLRAGPAAWPWRSGAGERRGGGLQQPDQSRCGSARAPPRPWRCARRPSSSPSDVASVGVRVDPVGDPDPVAGPWPLGRGACPG